MLDALHEYAADKQVQVNVSKTEILEFGSRLAAQRRQPAHVCVYGPDRAALKRAQ